MSEASEEALGWQVLAREGEARAGELRTRRGVIETPVFMPVGTLGTVKGVRFEELEAETSTRASSSATRIIFCCGPAPR